MVAYKRLKAINFQAQKVAVAVAYRRWSFSRDIGWENLGVLVWWSFIRGDRLREVVARGSLTVVLSITGEQ